MWARVSLFRRFTDANVYGDGSVKIMENLPQNIRRYTDIFTVYRLNLSPAYMLQLPYDINMTEYSKRL